MADAWTGSDAELSDDGRHRYRLRRWVEPTLFAPVMTQVLFVLLNPSTADAQKPDATVRKTWGFTRLWEHHRLSIVNLFSYRTRDPDELVAEALAGRDVVGPRANEFIRSEGSASDMIVLGWGKAPGPKAFREVMYKRVLEVMDLLAGRVVMCLGENGDGSPPHPLYLPFARVPTNFVEAR